MAKSVVIVESPAKARTIEKYLGKEYTVHACSGHIKDLPKGILGVDIERDFCPTYRIIPGKEKIVGGLKKIARNTVAIYLAADPDREGEIICQHLAEELDGSEKHQFYRVLFSEITQTAIEEAFKNPSQIDRNKVEAQQARRIVDRLVGYKVSPLLWRKVRSGLSAGRVQSVALRIIVDRENEIRSFVSEEYWNFTARLSAKNPPIFEAKAFKRKGKKFKVSSREEADRLLDALRAANFIVAEVKRKKRKRHPVAPFITSKLQQEAWQKLRFSVKKTMMLAQRLYEGVEIGGEGRVGLITYMRTDSTRVAASALHEVREFIGEVYGENYLPPRAVIYRGKKGAQDAHEATRPTGVLRAPGAIKSFLGRDELRLYTLIWQRFVASQMKPALFDQTEIGIVAGPAQFKGLGSILKFDGFLKVYQESSQGRRDEEKDTLVPEVKVGEKLVVEGIQREQKFTQPPSRYSEATLVKVLEEKGIGRPSTYAQILTVIQGRDYVKKEEARFVPTEVGEIVIGLLVNHFREIFDYDYTARLEKNLDNIERGKEDRVETLRGFYAEFSRELRQARKEMKNLKKEEILADVVCEQCGSKMVIRWGRFGKFLACSNYPACKNTKKMHSSTSGDRVQISKPLDESCPSCSMKLVERQGRYGPFVACSNYPTCKYVKPDTTGIICPQCGNGEIVRRRSRRGRTFYSCAAFPDCQFVLWQKPVPRRCPSCGAPYLLERLTKKEGLSHSCGKPECSYQEVLEPVSAG